MIGYWVSCMGSDNSSNDTETSYSLRLPPLGKGVFVRHQGRDRMAYREADGIWRDHYSGDILQGEVIYSDCE